jgi:hypothetical protein
MKALNGSKTHDNLKADLKGLQKALDALGD